MNQTELVKEFNTEKLLDWIFSTETYEAETFKQDITSTLPSEIWFNIFDFLPISQLYRIGKTSQRLRQVVQKYGFWQNIVRRGGLRTSDNNSYYGLVLEYSKQICELCGHYYKRDSFGSFTCLPVIVHDSVLNLCLKCRRLYYKKHPEPSRQLPERHQLYIEDQSLYHYSLPIFTAMVEYALSRQELESLKHVCHASFINSPPVRHYIESDVVQLARYTHGGDVGIYQAIASSLIRYRITTYQMKSCSRDRVRRKLVIDRAEQEQVKFYPESSLFIDYVLFGKGNVNTVLEDMKKLDWLYQNISFLNNLFDMESINSRHLLVRKYQGTIIRSWVSKRIYAGNYMSAEKSEVPENLWEAIEIERIFLIKEKLKERVVRCVANLWDEYKTGKLENMDLSREQFLAFINTPKIHCSCLLSDAIGIKLEHLDPVIELSSCVTILQSAIAYSI